MNSKNGTTEPFSQSYDYEELFIKNGNGVYSKEMSISLNQAMYAK